VWNQWSEHPQADLERASQLVHKALDLDDSNSVALNTLSYVDWMQRRYDQAVVDAERAVAINPNDARGYTALSDALALSGFKPEEALRAVEQAMRSASIPLAKTSTLMRLEMPIIRWVATRRRFPLSIATSRHTPTV
jgi:tetratricopeptide (TPR) repeat protein